MDLSLRWLADYVETGVTPKQFCDAMTMSGRSVELSKISCPAFVIGAKNDLVLTGEASEKIARMLSCELYLYEEYSHGVYDEAVDFNQRVLTFLKK